MFHAITLHPFVIVTNGSITSQSETLTFCKFFSADSALEPDGFP